MILPKPAYHRHGNLAALLLLISALLLGCQPLIQALTPTADSTATVMLREAISRASDFDAPCSAALAAA